MMKLILHPNALTGFVELAIFLLVTYSLYHAALWSRDYYGRYKNRHCCRYCGLPFSKRIHLRMRRPLNSRDPDPAEDIFFGRATYVETQGVCLRKGCYSDGKKQVISPIKVKRFGQIKMWCHPSKCSENTGPDEFVGDLARTEKIRVEEIYKRKLTEEKERRKSKLFGHKVVPRVSVGSLQPPRKRMLL